MGGGAENGLDFGLWGQENLDLGSVLGPFRPENRPESGQNKAALAKFSPNTAIGGNEMYLLAVRIPNCPGMTESNTDLSCFGIDDVGVGHYMSLIGPGMVSGLRHGPSGCTR
jgi:hypothetical protein